MTGVELIVAALAAGAAAGVSDTAGSVVRDAYTAFKTQLAKRLAGRNAAREALEAGDSDPRVWQDRLGEEIVDCGAAGDPQVLALARLLLELLDPHGASAPAYAVNIDTNYGAAGTFTAPVTITNRGPIPPASPEAV